MQSYEADFEAAVRAFWQTRDAQSQKQFDSGITIDAGTRGSVTGGKHLDAVAELVGRIFADKGFPPESIRMGAKATLPGFFRGRKSWDVVVLHGSNVVATVELKSQVGSFGNNLNNRIEEAVGQSVDYWKAADAGIIPGLRPWFGYLMIVEEHAGSTKPVKPRNTSLFPPDPVFRDSSYLQRYATAFDRLYAERLIDAVCFAQTKRDGATVAYPSRAMTFDHFSVLAQNRCDEVLSALGSPKKT